MFVIAVALAAVAALLHVYIFVLESLWWTRPATRRIFGVRSEQDALTMRSLAFNQGFYNLFLAAITIIGVIVAVTGQRTVAATLMLAGTGTMLAAALVLVLADRSKLRAAAVQGTVPLLAVVALSLSIVG